MSLPELPSSWNSSEHFKAYGKLSPTVPRSIEPVGPGFLAHARRTLKGRTWSEDEKLQAAENVRKVDAEVDDDLKLVPEEPEDPKMLTRDPKDWKKQDHYAVLGLSQFRYNATEEQIRIAHRRKVLKHHPDKKAASGAGVNEDGFFKCIQKANEILMDPTKRLQFDSVDKKADVAPPKATSFKTPEAFVEAWKPVFDAEARFSTKKPVPSLGDADSSKADIDSFYSFWYNFDSWRTFEYLDEDVPDDSANRDHKRYIEKKNKAARQKHKTDDINRLRKLVDDALAADPRIKLFRQKEKEAKAKAKWDKEAGAREAAAKAAKEKEEAEAAAKKAEEEAKVNREANKKNKEAAKNAKKKNKRTVRGAVKDANYFSESAPSAAHIDSVSLDIDHIIDALDDEGLDAAAKSLAGVTDKDKVKEALDKTVEGLADSVKKNLRFFK